MRKIVQKEVLKGILSKKCQDAGMWFDEDEDFVYLKWGEKTEATFCAIGVTVSTIQHTADLILAGISFGKVIDKVEHYVSQ